MTLFRVQKGACSPRPEHRHIDRHREAVEGRRQELRNLGLYNDSLDGVIGPETKRALAAFQKANGLNQTATLDEPTANALIGDTGIGQGSGMPPKAPGAIPMTNSSGISDWRSQRPKINRRRMLS